MFTRLLLIVCVLPFGVSGSKSDPQGTFRTDALQAHNALRSIHGTPAMVLSDDLNQFAQEWAETVGGDRNLRHSSMILSDGQKVGENLAEKCVGDGQDDQADGEDLTVQDVLKKWYKEINDYSFDFGDAADQPKTAHFTQVIWKNSTELGIGKAADKQGTCVYTVAIYRKPGNENIAGNPDFWKENVPRPLV